MLFNLKKYDNLYGPEKKALQDTVPIKAEDVMDEWYDSVKADFAYATQYEYEKIMKANLRPFLKNKLITDIEYPDVKKFLGDLGAISAKRKSNILIPLRATMKHAKCSKYITEDCMPLITNKSSKTNDIRPFSLEELKAAISNCHPDYADYFFAMALTGMRVSEGVGLRWHRVNFDKLYIEIRESIVQGVVGVPKTLESIRYIDMLLPVREALLRQKERTFSKEGYVFINKDGNPINPGSVARYYWRPALKKAGVRYRPVKQLRHTFATLMIDAGEKLGWVQAMMGHKNLGMIIRHYYKWIRRSTKYGKNFMKMYDQSANKTAS